MVLILKYLKGFLKYVLIGILSVTLYIILGLVVNQLFSPEIRRAFWGDGDNFFTVLFFAILPIIIYFGIYGLWRADTKIKKSEKVLSRFRKGNFLPHTFFISSFFSLVINSLLILGTLTFGIGSIMQPWDAGGNGILQGFFFMLIFFQVSSAIILLTYYRIKKNTIKDTFGYYIFAAIINIIVILYSLFLYYPYGLSNLH